MTDQQTTTSSTTPHLSLLQTLSPPNNTSSPAWSISFTHDAKYLAVCYGCPNTCVKIWRHVDTPNIRSDDGDSTQNSDRDKNVGEWRQYATIEGHSRSIRDVKFAPLSSLILATASFDGMIIIWEGDRPSSSDEDSDNQINYNDNENHHHYNTDKLFEPIAQLEGHENEVKCLAWNATGSLLASCGRDKTVWIWECFLPGTVGGAAMASGGAMEQDDGDFECLAVLQGHDGDVKSIAFAPSHSQWGEGEEILISASYDNSIKIWAEESGDWYCAATLGTDSSVIPQSIVDSSLPNNNGSNDQKSGPVHTSTVWCLSVTPSGVRFLSGSEDGSIAIWKMYTASERKSHFPNYSQYVSSTDGLWNCVGILPEAHEGYAVLSIDCAPSRAGHGRIVSGGGDDCIRIYREVVLGSPSSSTSTSTSDAPKFAVDAVVEGAHEGDVNCVKWHPRDGMSLFSCGDDGAVKVWRYS